MKLTCRTSHRCVRAHSYRQPIEEQHPIRAGHVTVWQVWLHFCVRGSWSVWRLFLNREKKKALRSKPSFLRIKRWKTDWLCSYSLMIYIYSSCYPHTHTLTTDQCSHTPHFHKDSGSLSVQVSLFIKMSWRVVKILFWKVSFHPHRDLNFILKFFFGNRIFLVLHHSPPPPPSSERWGGGAVSGEEGSVSVYKSASCRFLPPSSCSPGSSCTFFLLSGSSSSWASVTWNQPPASQCWMTSCRTAAT